MGNMSLIALLIAILLMGLITFLLRAFPTFVPKKVLDSYLLRYLNYALPLSVMAILIIHSMEIDFAAINGALLLAKVGALAFVLGSYIRWRNVFLSVIIGVVALNGLIYLIEWLVQ
ncbi:AzlD domain-containing protein [Ignatzschineria larvae DSM 13226]|uniref:AzlD domain-containing protein n=1 Tax=Ignatzschineria larvae DSM 13226 TaxID=1111732 RepID=A0ABZ3C2H1_9GAMM|nr:AzlD domain-containing protein [Ignatzschineria larvae]